MELTAKGLRSFEVPGPGKIVQGGADAIRPIREDVQVAGKREVDGYHMDINRYSIYIYIDYIAYIAE